MSPATAIPGSTVQTRAPGARPTISSASARKAMKRIVRSESAGSPARSCRPRAQPVAAQARKARDPDAARRLSRLAAAHQGSQDAAGPELAKAERKDIMIPEKAKATAERKAGPS